MLVYKDTIKLEFGETNHRYTISKLVDKDLWTEPEAVVGVTTIIGVLNKPALMLWPLREAIKYLEAHKDAPITKKLLDEAYEAHKQKSQKGKDAGKTGHALVEALLLDKKPELPTDPEALKEAESVALAFEKWRADYAPKVLYTEKPFYSLRHEYAGTCDLVAEIDGKTVVIDFKTTNPSYYNPDGLYAENLAQVGAYAEGLEEMLGLEVDDCMVVNLPKNGDEYKVKSLSGMRLGVGDAKMYFLYCLGLYKLHKDFDWKLKG